MYQPNAFMSSITLKAGGRRNHVEKPRLVTLRRYGRPNSGRACSVRPRSLNPRPSCGGTARAGKLSGAGNPESGQGARRSIVACVISFKDERAKPAWGASRIHGELLMLGFGVAQSTVSKYMVRGGTPPSHSWQTFLRDHALAIAAIDLHL